MRFLLVLLAGIVILSPQSSGAEHQLTASERAALTGRLENLRSALNELSLKPDIEHQLSDIRVFEKAADWILRHDEFYKPDYVQWTVDAIELGLSRLRQFQSGQTSWVGRIGTTVLGYTSRVDGSVQPYAVRLPAEFNPQSEQRWPLHVELHGRGSTLNEVSFIHAHEGKTPTENTTWIQLDVFGRTNNAYRWAGETDVLEAMHDVRRRFRIDDRRITLRGFSMGGAGAWHLGMHYPDLWSSVGAGAGFCDTIHHLNLTEPLSPLHTQLIGIYDAQDYALNAFNVPTIGYGGELDKQLFASGRMTERAAALGVTIPRLIGPGTEHTWHPESLAEFMRFHQEYSAKGRPLPGERLKIRFSTKTVRYNSCDWISIEEQQRPYDVSTMDVTVSPETKPSEPKTSPGTKTAVITTNNVGVLKIHPEAPATEVSVDGSAVFPLQSESDTKRFSRYLEKTVSGWREWDAERSLNYENKMPDHQRGLRKRSGLQGPIDDAFMESFICVLPTGTPWSTSHQNWSNWTFHRFEQEFDKWMRAKVRVVPDRELTPEMIEKHHLIIFGDPGSSCVLASIMDELPVTWTRTSLVVNSKTFDPEKQALAMVYPNPKNPRRYVVLNSGHTFHAAEFLASNANLYPRLGDVAVLDFVAAGDQYSEEVRYADVFDIGWKFRAN